MFVYEFMSGIAETVAGDEQEEDYDPHKHRRVEKPTSYGETMTHLLKGSIGAGILAMPDAVRRTGVIWGIIGIAVIGSFATYCIHVLIKAQYVLCVQKKVGYISYPQSMSIAVATGPPMLRWSAKFFAPCVDFVLIFWQLGLCAVYTVFVAENVQQAGSGGGGEGSGGVHAAVSRDTSGSISSWTVTDAKMIRICDFHGLHLSIRLHLCFWLIPLIIVNMVKDLKLLTPLSSLSNIVMSIGLALVFYYLIENDVVIDEQKIRIKGVGDLPIFIGTTLFALEAVGVILALEYNMDQPKRFLGKCGLFNVGMLCILTLYGLVGICGYLTYGENIQASITLNLPKSHKKAQAAKLIIAFAIFLTYPLQNFVAYNILWQKVKVRSHPSNHTLFDYGLRIALILLPWLAAVAVPKLGPFISLLGAFCLSLLAIIFPALLESCLFWGGGHACKHLKNVFIMLVGIICLFSGVYTSIHEMAHSK